MGRTKQKVTVNDFAAAVSEILQKCNEQVGYVTTEALIDTANEARRVLRSTAPKKKHKGGKYQRGFNWKLERYAGGGKVVHIWNAGQHASLAHLLENGHATRNGGFVDARPHFAPVNDAAQKLIIANFKKKWDGVQI